MGREELYLSFIVLGVSIIVSIIATSVQKLDDLIGEVLRPPLSIYVRLVVLIIVTIFGYVLLIRRTRGCIKEVGRL